MGDNQRALYASWTLAVVAIMACIQLGVGAVRLGIPLHVVYGLSGAGIGAAIVALTIVAHRLGELAVCESLAYPPHPGATEDWDMAADLGGDELHTRRWYRNHRHAQRRMESLRRRREALVAERYPAGFVS